MCQSFRGRFRTDCNRPRGPTRPLLRNRVLGCHHDHLVASHLKKAGSTALAARRLRGPRNVLRTISGCSTELDISLMTSWRRRPRSIPRLTRICAATPSPSRINPSSRCYSLELEEVGLSVTKRAIWTMRRGCGFPRSPRPEDLRAHSRTQGARHSLEVSPRR